MIPLNMFVYVKSTYGKTINIEWSRLIVTIAIIVLAVISGLGFRYWKRTQDWVPKYLTIIGTIAGTALILHSTLVTAGNTGAPMAGNPWHFYVSLMTPGLIGFVVGLLVASIPWLNLPKPTRVAIAVETCFQNVGIALAAALTLFTGTDSAWGVRAAVLYGISLAICLAVCLLICWKAGWTLAPSSDPILKVLFTEYQYKFQEIEMGAVEPDENLGGVLASDSATMLRVSEPPSPNSNGTFPLTDDTNSIVDIHTEKIALALRQVRQDDGVTLQEGSNGSTETMALGNDMPPSTHSAREV